LLRHHERPGVFIHLSTTSAILDDIDEEHTLQIGLCELFNGLSHDAETPPPDNDTCDTAETIVPEMDAVSTSFAFSGSTPDLDLHWCGDKNDDDGDRIGIWYKLVGSGVPVSAAVSFTATSPVGMTIYKSTTGSGCDSGAGLSCMMGDIERASSIDESTSGSDSACFDTKEGEEYFIHLSTTSTTLEGLEEEHTLQIGTCQFYDVASSTTDPTLSPDTDVCDTAVLIVPGDALASSFAVSGSIPNSLDLPVCDDGMLVVENGESNRGILFKVVGTGVPLSVTVSFTATSPVTMTLYSRSSAEGSRSYTGCDKGAGLSCMTNNI
jgi:hypothetical protein